MTINYHKIDLGADQQWAYFQGKTLTLASSIAGETKVYNAYFEVEHAPAKRKIGDDIRASVWGKRENEDGGALLENPSTIIKDILTDWMEVPVANIDSSSFETARLALSDVVFAFSIKDGKQASQIVAELAAQARCWLFWDGTKYYLLYRPMDLPASVRSIGPTGVTGHIGGMSKIIPLGLDKVYNKLVLKYSDKNTGDADPYKHLIVVQDSVSQGLYGIRTQTLEYWAVTQADWAGKLANFYLAQQSVPRYVYQCQTYLGNCDLMRGDVVTIVDSKWGLSNAVGTIIGQRFLPGDTRAGRMHTIQFSVLLQPVDWTWIGGQVEPEDPDQFDPGEGRFHTIDDWGFFTIGDGDPWW